MGDYVYDVKICHKYVDGKVLYGSATGKWQTLLNAIARELKNDNTLVECYIVEAVEQITGSRYTFTR